MGTKRPGGRSADNLARIMAATADLLVEKGYGRLTTEEVAERAGVHRSTVHRRFPTRAELVAQMMTSLAAERVPVPDTGRLESDLLAFARAVRRATAEPVAGAITRAVVAEGGDRTELGAVSAAFWARRWEAAGDIVRRAIAGGELPTGDRSPAPRRARRRADPLPHVHHRRRGDRRPPGRGRGHRRQRRKATVRLTTGSPGNTVRRMKFGLYAINYGTCADPESLVRVAQHAEAAGLDSLWAGEHIVLPSPQPPDYPIAPRSRSSTLSSRSRWRPPTRRRSRSATGILELPLHQPVLLAKQLASVDQIAGGRLVVGVGVGYLAAEFAALGVPLDERATRTDEYLEAMRALWTMATPEFHGRHVDFAGVDAHPRPVPPWWSADHDRRQQRAGSAPGDHERSRLDPGRLRSRRHPQGAGRPRPGPAELERPASLGPFDFTVISPESRLDSRSWSRATPSSASTAWSCSPASTCRRTVGTTRSRSTTSSGPSTTSPSSPRTDQLTRRDPMGRLVHGRHTAEERLVKPQPARSVEEPARSTPGLRHLRRPGHRRRAGRYGRRRRAGPPRRRHRPGRALQPPRRPVDRRSRVVDRPDDRLGGQPHRGRDRRGAHRPVRSGGVPRAAPRHLGLEERRRGRVLARPHGGPTGDRALVAHRWTPRCSSSSPTTSSASPASTR